MGISEKDVLKSVLKVPQIEDKLLSVIYWGNGVDTNIDIDTGIVENYLTVNPTSYQITNNTLTVHFTTSVNVKEAKINTDGSTVSFPYVASSFTQTSATFDVSSVTDGDYNIRLQVGY